MPTDLLAGDFKPERRRPFHRMLVAFAGPSAAFDGVLGPLSGGSPSRFPRELCRVASTDVCPVTFTVTWGMRDVPLLFVRCRSLVPRAIHLGTHRSSGSNLT